MNQATQYKIYKLLSDRPDMNQRELAKELGLSLGRTNYCLQALIAKGLLKTRNFRSSKKKAAYLYILTPEGMRDKAELTVRFLRTKMQEYEKLKQEIEDLRQEVEQSGECIRD